MKAKVVPIKYEEESYKLTPKGCAVLALMDGELIESPNDYRIEDFWTSFEKIMRIQGYIKE